MYHPLTARARTMMLSANREALRFQHEYVGTEHLLLALTAQKGGVALEVLKHFGVDPRKVRGAVEAVMRVGPDAIPTGTRLVKTPRCKNAMYFAGSEAAQMNHDYVGTEHLLLGLLREDTGVAAQILMDNGLKLREVRDEVMRVLRIFAPQEIDDLPDSLKAPVAELNDEMRRMTSQKEQSVGACDFEKAAALRDSAEGLKRRKRALVQAWASNYPLDPVWLSWGGAVIIKLAQRIHDRCRWDALPELAAALEQAGCKDTEILGHCRQAGEHSSQCWVVDLLLAKGPAGE